MTGSTTRGRSQERALVASSANRKGRGWRRRGPVVLAVLLCVLGVTAAVTGAARPLVKLGFVPVGHWVYDSVLQSAVHVDGGSADIDARVNVPGDPGSMVVQGDSDGYVVGRGRITVFGKSSLQVESATTPPADEVPVPVETAGGPYLVYRDAGKIVRVGEPQAVLSTGGPVGDPVATSDGSVWLLRTAEGVVCKLSRDADRISTCPAELPSGHVGALTVVGDQPELLDVTASELHQVGDQGTGPAVPIGVRVSPQARPAPTDVEGKVAILDPADHTMHLVDATRPDVPAVTIALPAGKYTEPASTGAAVAVVDRSTGTVRTFGVDGKPVDSTKLPAHSGDPRLTRSEDGGVYVEAAQGSEVVVVHKDGAMVDVPLAPKPAEHPAKPAQPPSHAGDQPQGKPDHPGPEQDHRSQPPQHNQPAEPDREPASPVVPASPPGAPSAVDATAGAGSAKVSWGAAPANRAPITGYRISWRTSAGATKSATVGGRTRSTTVSGLTNGTRYVFSVSATNEAGRGPSVSADPVTPGAAPGTPTGLQAAVNSGTGAVTWKQPNLNGGTLQSYTVTMDYTPAGGNSVKQTKSTTATSQAFTGLPTSGDGTAVFTVRAVTKTGTQVRTGAPASTTVQVTGPTITIKQGDWSESDECDPPDCGWVDMVMTGFAPNTTYHYTGNANGQHWSGTYPITTDANGDLVCNEISCPRHRWDLHGVPVYVYIVDMPGGQQLKSNTIIWQAP